MTLESFNLYNLINLQPSCEQ